MPQLLHTDEGAPVFDLAGEMLAHILGKELKPLAENYMAYGKLLEFPQAEFVDLSRVPDHSMAQIQMQQTGDYYIPHACETKQCDLHISLHGWNGGQHGWLGRMNVINYAATNDLIVLFPFSSSEWHMG